MVMDTTHDIFGRRSLVTLAMCLVAVYAGQDQATAESSHPHLQAVILTAAGDSQVLPARRTMRSAKTTPVSNDAAAELAAEAAIAQLAGNYPFSTGEESGDFRAEANFQGDPYSAEAQEAPVEVHHYRPRFHSHPRMAGHRNPFHRADPEGTQGTEGSSEAGASEGHVQDVIHSIQSMLSTGEFRQATNGSTPSANIEIGTPPKKLYVILDTGSDKLVAKTWATIKHELKMVDGGIDDSVMPSPTVYAHNSSSTYVHLYMPKGKMPTRSDYSDPSARVDGLNKVPKRGYIAYGSGIAITEEGLDVVGVGGRQLPHFPLSEIAADSLSMLHTKQGISGILGLQHMKNKTLGQSVFTSMRHTGQMQAFGYCRGNDNDGTFIWGDKSTEGHEIPVIGQIHWALPLGMVRMTKGASTAQPSNEAPAGHRAHHHQSDEIVINGKDSGSDSQSSDGGGGDGAAAASGETQEPMRHARAPSMRWDMMPDPTHEGEAEGEREGSWEASSLAEKNGQPDEESGGITESSQTSSGGGDPDLKKEISDILGDVINKIVDKIEHRTQHKAAPAEEVTSKMVCGEGQSCAAIIDTGSNIIAGFSYSVRLRLASQRVFDLRSSSLRVDLCGRHSQVVRTNLVKRAARTIIEKYYQKLTLDFDTNKKICEEVADIPSKRLRNKIAGFVTHLMKRLETQTIRGISLKLQEEARERRMDTIPTVSCLALPQIDICKDTELMLASLDFTDVSGTVVTDLSDQRPKKYDNKYNRN
jgi:small subunit ribosomal protein S17e